MNFDSLNKVTDWAPGVYHQIRRYDHMDAAFHAAQKAREACLVFPGRLGDPRFHCGSPEMAQWLAERLNKAARYDQLRNSWAAQLEAAGFTMVKAETTTGTTPTQAEADALSTALEQNRRTEPKVRDDMVTGTGVESPTGVMIYTKGK